MKEYKHKKIYMFLAGDKIFREYSKGSLYARKHNLSFAMKPIDVVRHHGETTYLYEGRRVIPQ